MPAINPIVLNSLADLQPSLYWLDADPLEPSSHSALTSDIQTDLCIIGAGYTGLWTALLAKERDPNREVVIIEMRETGNGASGRNGGFCNASLTHGFVNGYTRFADEMVTIEKLDEVYMRVFAEPSIEQELAEFFTYEYPGARFTPQFRARLWDGKVRLYDQVRKTLYVGLVSYVEEFATRNGYGIE